MKKDPLNSTNKKVPQPPEMGSTTVQLNKTVQKGTALIKYGADTTTSDMESNLRCWPQHAD